MRRLWNAFAFIVMVVAAVLAGFMAIDQSLAPQSQGLQVLGNGFVMSLVGVAAGIMIAWGWRINWGAIPPRVRYWLALQRKRFWWTTTAVASLGILFFY